MRKLTWIDVTGSDTQACLHELNTEAFPKHGISEEDVVSIQHKSNRNLGEMAVTLMVFYWQQSPR